MEPDRALALELAAVDSISANELDEIFEFDCIPPTQSLDVTITNREELSSQYTEPRNVSARVDSELFNLFDETSKNSMDSCSVVITTQDIEQIDIDLSSDSDFSTLNNYGDTQNEKKKNETNFDLTSKLSQPSTWDLSSRCQTKTNFDKEFADSDDSDSDFPMFDEETIAQLDRDIERSLRNEGKSNTQLQTEKYSSINRGHMFNSCPQLNTVPQSPPTTSREALRNYFAIPQTPPTTSKAAARSFFTAPQSPPTTSKEAARNFCAASYSPPSTSSVASNKFFEAPQSPPTTSRAAANKFLPTHSPPTTSKAAASNFATASYSPPSTSSAASRNYFAVPQSPPKTSKAAARSFFTAPQSPPTPSKEAARNFCAVSYSPPSTSSAASHKFFDAPQSPASFGPPHSAARNLFTAPESPPTTSRAAANKFFDAPQSPPTTSKAAASNFATGSYSPPSASSAASNKFFDSPESRLSALIAACNASCSPGPLEPPHSAAAPQSPRSALIAAANRISPGSFRSPRSAARNLFSVHHSPPTTKKFCAAPESPPTTSKAAAAAASISSSPPSTSRAATGRNSAIADGLDLTYPESVPGTSHAVTDAETNDPSILSSLWTTRDLSQCIADISKAMTEKILKENQTSTSDPTAIPQAVSQLYDIMKPRYSDFCFVYALCAQLCQDEMPMGCFVNIKMALLLSLASIGKHSGIAPIPIVVISQEPYMPNKLLNAIAELAARFLGPVDESKHPAGDRKWIDADPIQLAQGGVFYVGEWSAIKKQRTEELFTCVELSQVSVARSTRVYPLQTAIWAHWFEIEDKAKDRRIFEKFHKIFGIPVLLDDLNHEALVDFILKKHSVYKDESTIDHLSISADEMRQFLAVISQRTVDFTDEASELLEQYFVATRVERPGCLTQQAFTILKQYSESFAKLSLRHEVLAIDVVGAVFLSEHFLRHRYGAGLEPSPVLDTVGFVGDVEAYVARLHEWIKGYVEKFCNIKQ